ncbi:MAG: T9SS type A sorting domain-containing protein [Flavobacteriales bacterium]|nr:T9SS type A sorting domain-containing protein [Flavobacteriales bacterium]
MKKSISFLISVVISTFCIAQSSTLSFDGIDDNIDLGTEAASGIRTLECWFRLDNEIDASLSNFSSIVVRDTPTQLEELFLCFFPVGTTPSLPGQLVFGINLQSTIDRIAYSDSNRWEANRWYHVAGVIDPINGMSLYIDGIKQSSSDTNTSPSESSIYTTTVGAWGSVSGRNFGGDLDDLRFSSDAIYSANFVPPCPNLTASASTSGLWNFNENSGTTAFDSSSNNYDGQIFGSIWDTAFICNNVGIKDLNIVSNSVNVYPNPSSGTFSFQLINSENLDLGIEIYNSQGQMIISRKSVPRDFDMAIENQNCGIYFYKIASHSGMFQTGILVKR